jgi:hypothetical protein
LKRLLIAIAMAAAASTGQAVNGQTFQNGPYYASPSWDQKIPTAQRFVVLSNWGNEAVLDRETGLVWQRTPTTQQLPLLFQVLDCYSDTTGGRMGWRLPTPEELLSLADPTQHDPALPAGNPFQLGTTRSFWTVSTVFPPTRTDAGPGLVVGFTDGDVGSTGTDQSFGRWCVRGGSHVLTNFISP